MALILDICNILPNWRPKAAIVINIMDLKLTSFLVISHFLCLILKLVIIIVFDQTGCVRRKYFRLIQPQKLFPLLGKDLRRTHLVILKRNTRSFFHFKDNKYYADSTCNQIVAGSDRTSCPTYQHCCYQRSSSA